MIFLILGLINSKLLSPLNKFWIKLGEILGNIIAPIVMALVYFVILTPVSLNSKIIWKRFVSFEVFKKIKHIGLQEKKHLVQ